MAKTPESKLGLAVMQVLASRSEYKAHVRTLIKGVPDHITLTEQDCKMSETRPNEQMWEQRARNLKSHDKTTGNVIAEGLVKYLGKGMYQLTDSGVSHLKAKNLL